MRPIYLDCNATSPIDPQVRVVLDKYLYEEFGNSGSRTHIYGAESKKAVQKAREEVANIVDADDDEVFFTSGATEADNISILGLEAYGIETNRKHIVTSTIEHKAVLEPYAYLESKGFEVTYLPSLSSGEVDVDALRGALREDTLLVSLMHVNNETGIIQPLEKICEILSGHDAFLHVDAAQGFGKDLDSLKNKRIDMLSISGHKIYGPKGVGALVCRRRDYKMLPLEPLFYGGGQERGLRPGTVPVYLVAALGECSRVALKDQASRREYCLRFKDGLLSGLSSLSPNFNGSMDKSIYNAINISIDGVDSEAFILNTKEMISVSNGSACTSSSYDLSYVLKAMGISDVQASGAIRFSWSHLTKEPDWGVIVKRIASLKC